MTDASIDPAARRRCLRVRRGAPGLAARGRRCGALRPRPRRARPDPRSRDLSRQVHGPDGRRRCATPVSTGPSCRSTSTPRGCARRRPQLTRRDLADRVVLVRGTAEALMRSHPAFTPAFVFLDGDHSRRGVARDLRALRDRLSRRKRRSCCTTTTTSATPTPPSPTTACRRPSRRAGSPRIASSRASTAAADCSRAAAGRSGSRIPTGSRPAAEIMELGREPLRSWFDRRVLGAVDRRLRR